MLGTVRASLAADIAPPSLVSDRLAAVSLADHAAKLRQTAPKEFTIVLAPPFVVLGDDPPETVRRYADGTVKWAVEKLKQEYFRSDPAEIISIWLFRDEASYLKHAKLLFDDTPTTRYGYYSASHRALVMNISTGGGTLVHEIVHPFIHANFPACPAWFNESLASLYEQCAENNGHIHGLVNWRYTGLEKAISDGKLITFKKLTAMTATEFYGGANNPNYSEHYAQSRYLCFYLQQNGLLTKFYREFVANAKTDPTGYETLQRVLGEKDMEAFQKKWEKFILGLRAP